MTEHLSPLDATFLELEEADESAHMHIGGVLVLDRPPEGVPTLDELRRRIDERLHLLPRYRQRLSEPHTGGLSWPAWVDHDHFDVADHVREAALPGRCGDEQLREWSAEFWSQRLDRHLPLWEFVLIRNVSRGRWAIATKTHHAMVDGIGSIDSVYLMLDASPEGAPVPPAPNGGPVPQVHEDAHVGLGTIPRLAAGAVRAGAGLARHPERLRDMAARSRAALEVVLRDEVVPAPHTSLNVPIGSRRRYAAMTVPLDEVKTTKRALGGTVNDVALAAVAGGLRRLLEARGEAFPAEGLRAMVPVNVRQPGERLGNHVSSLFVHLPVAAPEPEERWLETLEEARRLKTGTQAMGGKAIVDFAAMAPPVLHSLLARSLFGTRLFNVTVTNVPGPPMPLWGFGGRMREVWPFVPLAAEHGVGVAIVSYNGTLTFGVCGDHETVPDLGVLVSGIRESLDELRALARRAPAVSA